jgi:putative membrane protein
MHRLFWGYRSIPRLTDCWYGFADTSWWTRGFLIGILLLGLALVIVLSVSLARRSHANHAQSTSEEILRQRYARGEIDKATFDSMKRDLRG